MTMKKNMYLLFLIITMLLSLAIYSTYAMFTATIDVGDFTSITSSTLPTDATKIEYENIVLNPKDMKRVELDITNSTGNSLYYGVWYEMVQPSSINNKITIAKLDTSTVETSGQISASGNKKVVLVLKNKTSSDVIINIGVGYSNTSSLNLSNKRNLINTTSDYCVNPTIVTDASGANSPDLVQGLVPVTFDQCDGIWKKADISSGWYNYDNKQWANAVLVTSYYRDSNNNDTFQIGDEIPEDAILAHYVWIPRYKYKVWNIQKKIGTDTYSARTTGIDVVFENELETTGTIACTKYNYTATIASTRSETCSGSNGEYYTHPAFWWDLDGDKTRETGEELRGIWVGKFEVSNYDEESGSYLIGSTTYQVRTKPNVSAWTYNYQTSYSAAIQGMMTSDDYGLDSTTTDSHMMKNLEWGAMAYFTHSKYGRCNGSSCQEVASNTSNMITGGGDYISNVSQSTTANPYGLYDMHGGSFEYTMANMSSVSGSYKYYPRESSNGADFSYSTSTARYLDAYSYSANYDQQSVYNKAKLGDATGEIVTEAGIGWYDDAANFVSSTYPWFVRGGNYNDTDGGIFRFGRDNGTVNDSYSTRAILIKY